MCFINNKRCVSFFKNKYAIGNRTLYCDKFCEAENTIKRVNEKIKQLMYQLTNTVGTLEN